MDVGKLDGLIFANRRGALINNNLITFFKFYEIPNVGLFTGQSYPSPIYWLELDKTFITYLETNLIDACNLNCKGCTHFSVLFDRKEVYPLETFRRDIRILSQKSDILRFRLLGGEPLLLGNLDKYIKIVRDYLPQTELIIVTNGLLIPSLSQEILDALRENNCIVYISPYAPTLKIADKIKETLRSNKIVFTGLGGKVIDNFIVFLTLHSENNPKDSQRNCASSNCRFIRDGKIYKCPVDALSYRIAEKFNIKSYPRATGIDIYSPNFPLLFPMLSGDIEMCHWCGEKSRQILWEPTNNPKLEDWLTDPDELKNFL